MLIKIWKKILFINQCNIDLVGKNIKITKKKNKKLLYIEIWIDKK